MASGQMATPEGRASDRTRTFLKAVIEFNHGASRLDCVVKNMSRSGARIEITDAIGLPNEFNLRIPHRNETYRSQMIWREKGAIGVRFVAAEAEASEPLRAMADLEAENARLRARVRELTRRLESLGQDPTALDAS